MDYYIYLKFDFQGIPRYVGKGKGNRAYRHERYGNRHWNRQMKALVIEAKNRGELLPTVILANRLEESEAFALEKLWIDTIGRKAVGGTLYNWTDGGEGVSGHVHSEETREKFRGPMSIQCKEAIKRSLASLTPEARQARSEKQRKKKLGRKLSKETRLKIGASQPPRRDKAFGKLVSEGKKRVNRGEKFLPRKLAISTYLDCEKNSKLAASQLGVSRKTLNYRLGPEFGYKPRA